MKSLIEWVKKLEKAKGSDLIDRYEISFNGSYFTIDIKKKIENREKKNRQKVSLSGLMNMVGVPLDWWNEIIEKMIVELTIFEEIEDDKV